MILFKSLYKKTINTKISVRNRLLATFTFCLLIASINSIIFNSYLNLTEEINHVVITISIINAIALYLSYSNKLNNLSRFLYMMIIVSFLPFAWIFNGGLTGSIPMHFFIYLGAGVLILIGKYRNIFLTYLCCLKLILLGIELYYPEIIIPYQSKHIQSFDLKVSFIQVTLSILALTITFNEINSQFQKKLINQKEKLKKSYKELSEANEKTKEATIAKSNFISNISHEIRTPLNAIVGITDLLKQNKLTDEQSLLLSSLSTSSKILSDLVDDLLDFSKIEANKMNLKIEAFDIRKILQNAKHLISIQLIDKPVNFILLIDENTPEIIEIDQLKYKQILLNLLNNASKFTKEGSITCNVSFNATTQTLSTIISDTGIGISKNNLKHIFSPFTQLNTDYNLESNGIGMGLAITKKMVELMNGDISVSSEKNIGTTFEISIPVKKHYDSYVIIEKEPSPKTNKEKHTYEILIAEDNKINQIVLGKMLEKLNHTYDIAKDGVEAVEMATKKHYDIILMDVQMPLKNGLVAAKEIKKHFNNKHAKSPIIIGCSANVIHQESIDEETSAIQDFLTKPIGMEELSKTLEKIAEEN